MNRHSLSQFGRPVGCHWLRQCAPVRVLENEALAKPVAPPVLALLRRATSRSGFTLTEVLIVVTIIAIVGAVVLPSLQATRTHSLESVARILAADLRLARSHAIEYNTDWTVRFDVAAGRYFLEHSGSGSPPAPVNVHASAGQSRDVYVVDLSRLGVSTNTSGGVVLDGVFGSDSNESYSIVTFGPIGGTGPQSGSAANRSEDTVIRLSTGFGSEQRIIRLTVSWVTGQVWISELETPTNINPPIAIIGL